MNWFKHILKKHFLYWKIKDRFSPTVQIEQQRLRMQYARWQDQGKPPPFNQAGFRVFSQFEEDGLLLYLFSLIGMNQKSFIEIGSDDGVNSNSANLYFNFGWHGLFIDGNRKSIERGRHFYARYPHPHYYTPTFVHAMVTRENINELISQNGYTGEIGLLSIDIDGNDYWVWDAIEVVSPQVVVIETNNVFHPHDIVVPYDPTYSYPGKHLLYHGASPKAMVKLGEKKGYRLVGANALGFNFFFVKNGIADELIPEVEIDSVLKHKSIAEDALQFDEIKDWKYESP